MRARPLASPTASFPTGQRSLYAGLLIASKIASATSCGGVASLKPAANSLPFAAHGLLVRRRLVVARRARRVLEDRGHDHAGLDVHHAHAEAPQLEGQRLAHALQRELRGGVGDLVRGGDPAGDRGHVHDRPAPALAHAGHHRLDAADRAEVVGLEHLPVLVLGHEFERRRAADPCVVDQDVDRPARRCQRERTRGRVGRGHVELDHLDRQLARGCGFLERLRLGEVPHAGEHGPAVGGEVQRGREPDPGAGPGDDGDARCVGHRVRPSAPRGSRCVRAAGRARRGPPPPRTSRAAPRASARGTSAASASRSCPRARP